MTKNIVKKTKMIRFNRRLTESEAFIYPVGISRISLVLQQSLPPLMTERPTKRSTAATIVARLKK